ncbi:winged helix-turn-helix domain-containing protein [[Mycobacterium] nativiensis]|uniref:Winged helix-turn-helix domain-containing protein n=1 Tax=[Mycobacterium] nativiensis TaxID=2855503 RepID=A0ABU5XUS1_9MYCO|nr:winged helix-turn-helix domain-containing protein [Mycolicibacter sp. MYC340]MEB3031741.1 winged helix-turn-helix domain-containing protein [Mycolicibacter sp. MYC340]
MSGVSYAQSMRVQELSSIVFGQKHRLAVMAAIAQSDGLVNPSDLAEELGFRAQSAIQTPLKDLVAAGLITRQEGVGRVHYRRNSSSLWDAALELLTQALSEDVAAEHAGID